MGDSTETVAVLLHGYTLALSAANAKPKRKQKREMCSAAYEISLK